jgi:hypothetical protein
MIDPREFPEIYDFIVLGESISPGKVTLTGHERAQSWDTEKAKGQTGATSTYNGEGVGQFQASFYLASPEQQLAWPAFKRVIESTTSGAEPKALPVYHPDLAENRFTEVCNAGIGGAARDSRGGVTYTVKFIEYRPPKPKPTSTAAAAPNTDAGAAGNGQAEVYDPNREARRELDGLFDEAAEA